MSSDNQIITNQINSEHSEIHLEKSLDLQFSKPKNHFLQIDILKGLMIMLVIIDHAIPWEVRTPWEHSFWERISIPVFLIIMGFNAANSFKTHSIPLNSPKSYGKYLFHKMKRFIIPFLTIYLISTIYGLIHYGSWETMLLIQYDPNRERALLYYFMLPFNGPGNWFIPVVFQAMIIMPFLYSFYKKFPEISLVLSFIFDVISMFLIRNYAEGIWPTIFQLSVLIYFNALFIGFWIADHPNLLHNSSDDQVKSNNIEKVESQIPYHFYIVLLVTLILNIFLIRPWVNNLTGNEYTSIWIIFIGIIFVIGIYIYKPIAEFLVVLSISIALGLLFNKLAQDFIDTQINYALRDFHDLDIVYIAIGIFFIPYLLFALISLAKKIPKFNNMTYPKNQNVHFWILFWVSEIYISLYQQFWKDIFNQEYWNGLYYPVIIGDYNFLVFPHSVLIVLLFLTLIPKESKNKILDGFSYIGKASYHILFTQMFVYGLFIARFRTHYLTPTNSHTSMINLFRIFRTWDYMKDLWVIVIIMWLICLPIGVLWYLIERKIFSLVKLRKEKSKIKSSETKNEGITEN